MGTIQLNFPKNENNKRPKTLYILLKQILIPHIYLQLNEQFIKRNSLYLCLNYKPTMGYIVFK